MRDWLLAHYRTLPRRLWRDQGGQDMIEYALVAAAGFLAIAVVIPQGLAPTIKVVFSKVITSLFHAGSQGA